MDVKKIDHEQIKSVSLIEDVPEYNVRKMDKISTDGTGALVDDCTEAIKWCNENMKTAINQMNRYIDAIADEFKEMDKRITFGVTSEADVPFTDLVSNAVGKNNAGSKPSSANPFASKI